MSVRPRRFSLPLCVLAPPSLFLLYREVTTCGTPAGCNRVALAGYAASALVAPAGALLVARAVAAGRAPSWLAPRPDDATLAILGAIVGGFAVFLVAATLDSVPAWLAVPLAPAGVLLGLPLVIVNALLVGTGNSLGELPMTVQLFAVTVGVALSGAWWYLLAASVAQWAANVNEPRD